MFTLVTITGRGPGARRFFFAIFRRRPRRLSGEMHDHGGCIAASTALYAPLVEP